MDTWDEFIRESENHRSVVRKQFKLSDERLKKIKTSSMTRRIVYPEHKLAFDYVHKIYPFANIKQTLIYHAPKALLFDVGYVGVGGFYDISARVIVVTDHVPSFNLGDSDIVAEYTIDEVLCHEMIHYGAMFKNAPSSREVEEEIAYGKSINYMRLKGRTDDFIINKNMMPYLISVVDKKQVFHRVLTAKYNIDTLHAMSREGLNALLRQEQQSVEKEMTAEAYRLGKRMIALYGDDADLGEAVKPTFRKLDLSDDF